MTKIERVFFAEHKDAIIGKVAEYGDVADIETWKKAFPKIEFPDVDEPFTGKPIKWETYTPVEKAAYVAYMNSLIPGVSLNFHMDADGTRVRKEVWDTEELWYLWFYHTFTYFDKKGELSETALEKLLYYATNQNDFADLILDNINPENVIVNEMTFSHAPVVEKETTIKEVSPNEEEK